MKNLEIYFEIIELQKFLALEALFAVHLDEAAKLQVANRSRLAR